MLTEDKVTELFCMADDFFKFFDAMMEKYTLESDKKHHYHRDSTMSKAAIMLIMVLFHGQHSSESLRNQRTRQRRATDYVLNLYRTHVILMRLSLPAKLFSRNVLRLKTYLSKLFSLSSLSIALHSLNLEYLLNSLVNQRIFLCHFCV